MEEKKYVNPPLDLKSRSMFAKDSPRFRDIIDKLIVEFNKKSPSYYCRKFHSIETRTSEKQEAHKECRHPTKGDLIGNQ